MRRFWILVFALFFPLAVLAQSAAELSAEIEDDRGFLTGLLERSLSGAGRTVVIEGFQGALSSRATFTEMRIADDDGVWLTLRDGAIQWNRSALLRRRIEIAELTAREILLPRLPAAEESAVQAEVPVFALPELPVAVNIEQIRAERVALGEPVIGVEAALRIDGAMSLDGGEGETQLNVTRLDGVRGEFVLDSAFSNETRVLRLNLALDEAANGILANLIDIYERPALTAQISGEGPLSDFAADIRLATNGQPRITGRISANERPDETGTPGTAFSVQIGGDVASLLRPDDRVFFGRDTRLLAEGWRAETGRIDLPQLSLQTEALSLTGSLSTNDQNAPQLAELQILLGRDANAPVLPVPLPFADAGTNVDSGRLELSYDAAEGEGWTLTGRVGQVDRGGLMIGQLLLDGGGEIVLDDGALVEVTGGLAFGAAGLVFADAGLAQAVGDDVRGRARFNFTPGNVLDIYDVRLDGADFGVNGDFLVAGLASGITLSVDVTARHQDLSRLSQLADRDLTGSAEAVLNGYYIVLNRAFDLDARITATDLTLDQPQLDRLLGGGSDIVVEIRRDETGIEVEELSLTAARVSVDATGRIDSLSSDLVAQISMPSLAEADPDYGGSLMAEARLNGPSGQRRLTVSGETMDLRIGIDAVDRALAGMTNLTLIAGQTPDGYQLDSFRFANPQITASGEGVFAEGALDATADIALPSLSALDPRWSGALTARARLTDEDGRRLIDLTGQGTDLSLGQGNVDGALTGRTDLRVLADQAEGVVTLRDVRITNDQLRATATGQVGEGVTDLAAELRVDTLAPFGPGWRGALTATGTFREAGDGVRRLSLRGTGRDLALGQAQVDGALAGETQLTLEATEAEGVLSLQTARISNPRLQVDATGQLGDGATDLAATIAAGDLRFLGNGIAGALQVQARVLDQGGQRLITANGNASGLRVGQPRVDPVLAGQTVFDLAARQDAAGVSLQRLQVRNPQVTVEASGDPATGLQLDGRLANLGLIVPEFPGPATLSGTLREDGANLVMDLNATAPGGVDLRIAGAAARNGQSADLAITGRADSALANTELRTRSLSGPLAVNLRLAGPLALQSLSGTVSLSGGQLSDPGLGIRLEGINLVAAFQNGQLRLDGGGGFAAGGSIAVSGPVDLQGGSLDLAVSLNQAVLRDPNLYETRLDGTVRISGNLAAGPLVSGRIILDETEIRIPSTGLGGARGIPDIRHVGNQRPPVRATRARAGLEGYPSPAAAAAGLAGPPAVPARNPPRLNLSIEAPNRVFVRGRGVDAELGGGFQVQGTSRNVVPVGNLELIRGRVDLLGNRFNLTEGLIELQGSLIPVIRLVAETQRDGITTRIVIDGELREPDIRFESSPELPEEEVLSQLLFGRGLDTITPLQAAQLANAVAVLAGRGGAGIIGNLRDSAGLDDLDLTTDADGNVELRAGRYLTENVYTDVSVGESGRSTINLNLDITQSLRARGSVGSDGSSSLGVFFERDY